MPGAPPAGEPRRIFLTFLRIYLKPDVSRPKKTAAPPRRGKPAPRPARDGRAGLAMVMMLLLGSVAFYFGYSRALDDGRPGPAGPKPKTTASPRTAAAAPGPDRPAPEPEPARTPAPRPKAPEPQRSAAPRPEHPAPPPRAETPAPGDPVPTPHALRARVAIVIDDCGNNYGRDRGFVESEHALTLAVLPHLPATRQVAEEARARGKCVILHLPMETASGKDPGPGTLRPEMGDDELARVAREDFEAVPGIVGFNNHEGSRGSADARVVSAALDEARERGLFVLDSRTTTATVLAAEAADLGLPVRSRDVFLDNEDDVDRILAQLDRLREVASERGVAVAIGHPRPATLEALRRGLPRLVEAGIGIVPLSELMQGSPAGTPI